MRVLFATSEATPFIKSGGLADVLGSLPKEMVKKGVESIVVLPKYQDMKLADEIEYVTSFDIWVGWRKVYCGVFTYELDGVRFYFIDNEQYFRRPGLYGYDDDYERFAYFDFAVLELISHLDIKPDVLHLHDWQTAMIAMLYKERYCYYEHYDNIKIVFTIHNIAFQGKAQHRLFERILHAVAHDLPEQEAQPAPVGKDRLVRRPDLDPEAFFLQQRAVIVEHLVDAAAQRQPLKAIVAPRAAQTCVVEHLVDERLHPVAHVVELEAHGLRQRVAPVIEHERQQRQRRFHLMRPELHVVFVVVHLRL